MNFTDKVEHFLSEMIDSMFPIRRGCLPEKGLELPLHKSNLVEILECNLEQSTMQPQEIAGSFIEEVSYIKAKLDKDVEAIYEGDPSAKSRTEIILAYPGFYGIAAYRVAHELLLLNIPLIPRIITEIAHCKTGIDIHPGAQIGESICIDHGTGVVIGETTIIGDNVKIYQGVTLGALSIKDRNVLEQRHPTIEDNVIIYAQATILGGDTVIGHNSIVGGNVWLTNSIPPFSKIYYDREGDQYNLKTKKVNS